MGSITWKLCALCQEGTDKALKCPNSSKDVNQISQIYISRANLLKQFQTTERLSKDFHSELQPFLYSSSNPGKLFNNENAK